MGADISVEQGYIKARCKRLKGARIVMFPVLQSCYTAILGWLLAVLVYLAFEYLINEFLDEYSEEMQKTFLLRALLVVLAADLAENTVRGELLSPWYYPAFIALISAFALIPLLWKNPKVMQIAGWGCFFAVVSWMTIVRGVLGG